MQVAIHAGAAFTDDGRLLGSLEANRDVLAKIGVAPLVPRRGRMFVKTMSDALSEGIALPDARRNLTAILPGAPGIQRLILSSEKFFGPVRTAIQHGQFYPYAGRRTAFAAQLLEDYEVELFFGLVNPGSFIPKVLTYVHEGIGQSVIDSTDLSCLSWVSMIEDLVDLAPNVRITLWANEDTPLIWGDILRAMTGVPESQPLKDEHALLSSLLTESGKRELMDLIRTQATHDPQDVRDSLSNIFDEHALPGQIEEELDFPGWSDEIVEAFSEIYEQDLARIESMPNVRVLKP